MRRIPERRPAVGPDKGLHQDRPLTIACRPVIGWSADDAIPGTELDADRGKVETTEDPPA